MSSHSYCTWATTAAAGVKCYGRHGRLACMLKGSAGLTLGSGK
jgi:hypothetical protein